MIALWFSIVRATVPANASDNVLVDRTTATSDSDSGTQSDSDSESCPPLDAQPPV